MDSRSRVRALAVVALIAITSLATARVGFAGPPAGEFSVTGKVADKLVLSVAELAALPCRATR